MAKRKAKPTPAEFVKRTGETWKMTESLRLQLQRAAREEDYDVIDKAGKALSKILDTLGGSDGV
tara:strand:- start:1384 stop:1575 length:192 start_codon:yes stop_codon:yes gene_type:complete